MKPTHSACLAAALLTPAALHARAPTEKDLLHQFLRENREKFRVVEPGRDEIPFARIHTLTPAAKPLAHHGRFFTGYRFRAPEWLDGAAMWMMGRPEDPSAVKGINYFIVPEDPADDTDFKLFVIGREADRFPMFRERFPGCAGFILQQFPQQNLNPGSNYIVWMSFPTAEIPELKVAMTVQSARGLYEYGMLPTGYPYMGPGAAFTKSLELHRKDPKKSLQEANELFKKDGIPVALTYLDRELDNYVDTGDFHPFYTAAWLEAQVGDGRVEKEWRASVYQWLMDRCLKLEAFTAAERLVSNLCSSQIAANRLGAAHASLAIFRTGMERRNLELDPASYPDAGPAFAALQEVRHRNFPIMAARPISIIQKEGWVTASKTLSDGFCGSMGSMADLELAGGNWRTALERRLWVDRYIIEKRGEILEAESRWYENRNAIASSLQDLGLLEVAEAEYEAVIHKGWKDIYLNRQILCAQRDKIGIGIERGNAAEPMIGELDEIYNKLESNRYARREVWQEVEIIKARCLESLGRYDEAEQILARLSNAGNHRARIARIRLMLDLGKLGGIEGELLTVLGNARDWGRKLDEVGLYSLYADFLEKSGRLSEAVRMRREAVLLMRGFDLFAKLPPELARLSNLLARCGDVTGARSASTESTALAADRNRIPERIASEVASILGDARPAPVAPNASTQVDLQPARAFVAPIAGRPVRGTLALTNLSHHAVTGTLGFSGIPAALSTDESGVLANLGGAGGSATLDQLRVEPGNYVRIHLSSAPTADVEGGLSVWWRAQGQNEATSLWSFDGPETGVSSAVIDAGEYKKNPFYGVPIHHHYQHSDDRSSHADLRIIASAPARVELYDNADRPISIDAEGDGSFGASGDSVIQDADANGEPDVALEKGEAAVRLQVYPHGDIPPEGMTLKIQAWIDGGWLTVAEDRLLP